MGLLGRITGKFKKEEEIPETSERDLGMPARRAIATDFEPSVEEPRSGDSSALILTKLDMISLKLDNLDRRVQYIEKVAKESEK